MYTYGNIQIVPPSGVEHIIPSGSNLLYVPGLINLAKFGRNADIDTGTDPEDVWDLGALHPGIQTAAATTIVSSSADDAAEGTGARTVTVYGLSSAWALQSETVTLTGAVAVTLASQYIAVYDAKVITAGTGKTNAGTITITIGATPVAGISIGMGRSMMAWYPIPASYTGYLHRWYFDASKVAAAFVSASLRIIPFGGGIQTEEIRTANTDGANIHREYGIAQTYPEKTVVFIRADVTSADNVEVTGGFDMLLLKNI